jgi:hypothetical protein
VVVHHDTVAEVVVLAVVEAEAEEALATDAHQQLVIDAWSHHALRASLSHLSAMLSASSLSVA